jgi:hypothetical protein
MRKSIKLPSYPNYWQLATIGGGIVAVVGISGAISLLLRWRRKPKRKNSASESG